MAQNSVRSCPNCHTPLGPEQRFCSNCGTIVELNANKSTELTPNSAGSIPDIATRMATPPPPPPGSDFQSQIPPLPLQEYQTPAPGGYQPSPMGYQPPVYTQPQKDKSGRVLGQIGCGVLAIILLVLALCSTAGFFAYRYISTTASSVRSTVTTNGSIDSNGVTPTFAPPTVSNVNAAVKYADVDITVVDVKQGAVFSDDSSTASATGTVRVDLAENNKTTRGSGYYFGDMMHLLLPDGTSVKTLNEQISSGPDASVSRKNWVDFAVPLNVDMKKTTLRIGTAAEAVIDIPLTNNPDVSKYQPKTITPNKSTQYSGVTWTLTSATKQLSGVNKQAPQGQVYVIVQMKLDNNSSNSFIGYPGDYIRLQSGDTKATPDSDSTIPLSVNAGQTNQTGMCAFLVPQNSTDFTFLLLANSSNSVPQSSITFQIQ